MGVFHGEQALADHCANGVSLDWFHLLEEEGRCGVGEKGVLGSPYSEVSKGGSRVAGHLTSVKKWRIREIEISDVEAFEARRSGIGRKKGSEPPEAVVNVQLRIPEAAIHLGVSQRM